MTENEKKARQLMENTVNNGICFLSADLHLPEGEGFPALTDDECKRLALEYPVDLQEIRDTFPVACEYGCEDFTTDSCPDISPDGFPCTRPEGHDGCHVSCGTTEHGFAKWRKNKQQNQGRHGRR